MKQKKGWKVFFLSLLMCLTFSSGAWAAEGDPVKIERVKLKLESQLTKTGEVKVTNMGKATQLPAARSSTVRMLTTGILPTAHVSRSGLLRTAGMSSGKREAPISTSKGPMSIALYRENTRGMKRSGSMWT